MTSLPEVSANAPPEQAASAFRKAGCLVLRDLFAQDTVENWRIAFEHQYQSYLTNQTHDDALNVGNKRFKVSVKISPPFDTPQLFANPQLLPIIRDVLDESAVLASLVCVAALPGAKEQHIHRDHPWLFGTGLDRMLPAFAVKIVVPLVDLGGAAGTTKIWPGSHVVYDDDALSLPAVRPVLGQGDVLLMDYRLLHQGTPNTTPHHRPVLFVSYARKWFCDHENFDRQSALSASDEFLTSTAPNYRHLLQRLLRR